MPEREQNTGGQYEKGFNKTEKSVRHGTAYESESDRKNQRFYFCLLYTSDAADEL